MSNLDTTMTTSLALHACKIITNKPKKKSPLEHTHTYTYRSNGEGRAMVESSKERWNTRKIKKGKKRKITDSKLVTSVFISLFKEHMPLPSNAMGERNRRRGR